LSDLKRILVAEDDPSIAALLERALREHFEVQVVHDGHAALAAAAQWAPHLMLLDVMMPGLDGLAVAKHLKSLSALKSTPIIFLTAKDGSMDVIKGIQHGARHYITKPFKLDSLVQKIKKTLGS
jgi:DNA-binding response OmpR family regulator